MENVDVRSLMYFFTIGNFFILGFFIFYIVICKLKNPYLILFSVSKFLIFGCSLYLMHREELSTKFHIIFSNTLFFLSTYFELYSIVFFYEKFSGKNLLRLSAIPIFSIFIFIASFSDITSQRILIASTLVSVYYFAAGFYLTLKSFKIILNKILAIFFLTLAVILVIRAFYIYSGKVNAEIYSNFNIQVIAYTSWFLITFSSAFIIFLMQSNRKLIKLDLKLRENETNTLSTNKFLGIVIHDLRAPVINIYQLSDFLLKESKDLDENKKNIFTDAIFNTANSTLKLLDNLILWSKYKNSLVEIKPISLSLSIMVNEIFKFYSSIVISKCLKLENNVSQNVYVFADNNMLETILRNLVSNAIKFTPDFGIIEIYSIENADEIHICIHDNGVGIDEEHLNSILKIESDFTSLGTRNEAGTGYGLKLCKELIEKNNGKIWVESQRFKFTKFWISLPKPV